MVTADSSTRGDAPPRKVRTFAALGHRNFRLFWIGGLVSGTGRFFQALAIPIIIWDLTGSAGWVGLAGFAQFLPTALISPVAGSLADRYDRRRFLLFTQSIQAVAAAVFMVMWWSGVRSPTVYVVVGAGAGLVAGLNIPAWQAFVSELVPRDLLLNAVTLNSMQFNSARMFGPILAGFTIAAAGPGWAFFVNFVSYGAVLIALSMIRTPDLDRDRSSSIQPWRDFVETLAYIRRVPGIGVANISVFLIGMFGLPIQTLSVVFAEEVFDRGATGFGLMLTMVGAGAVLISPLVAGPGSRIARSRLQAMAFVGYSGAIIGFSVAPSFLVSLLALMMVGAAHLASASTLNTTIQIQVDEGRRAKVLAVYMMILLLSTPVGQLVLGQSFDAFGPRRTMFSAGLVMLAATVALLVSGRLAALDGEGGTYAPDVVPEAHPTYPVPPRDR